MKRKNQMKISMRRFFVASALFCSVGWCINAQQAEITDSRLTYSPREAAWQRPFTAKRYLHPPFAEQFITMWPDFRIMAGDIGEKHTYYGNYISSAFRLLAGRELESPDFKKTVYHVREDGVPVHSISSDMGEYMLNMESFCDIRRLPAAYSRVTVHNRNAWRVSGELAVVARTGSEIPLTGIGTDGYTSFSGEVGDWRLLSNTFNYNDNLLSDDRSEIRFKGTERFHPVWQVSEQGFPWHLRPVLRLHFTLEPGETISFDVMFRRGETADFDYDAEKKKTEAFWLGELKKIKSRPDTDNELIQNVINNLVAQCLQMFNRPAGKDYVLPRQGGLERAIWPVEAMEYLMALDRMGLYDYTEKAYDLFFNVMQEKDGADAGIVRHLETHPRWASNTGGALWGLSRHIIFRDDKKVFDKYRNQAMLAFEWCEKMRSHQTEGSVHGIFPPMKATDWGGEYQSWCWTDAIYLQAYKWLARMLEKYKDPDAKKVKAAYGNYLSVMRDVLQKEIDSNTLKDEIIISNRAGKVMSDPPLGPYFCDGPAMLIRSGVIQPNSEVSKLVENYFQNRGYFKNGLTGLMNDIANPHVWYTNFSDMFWFEHWMRIGEREKAQQTLEAQFKYAMTPEYYMNERYAANDPYWTPWLPNASANGRTIMMLFGWYNGEIENFE